MSEYGHRLSFDEQGMAQCPESLESYELKDGAVRKI
jgi:UDP-2-acetamido-3-amino-2,3-dideoxy-glucuronate N-acetyltransferase